MSRRLEMLSRKLPLQGHPWTTRVEAITTSPLYSLTIFAMLLGALLVIALISMALSTGVQAHMHDRPDLDTWLRTLYSKQRGPCCDGADAETAADPDWRNASEMKKGECQPSSSMSPEMETVYCVRLQNPNDEKDWRWWAVPSAAVVELPNRAGPALIWMYWSSPGTEYAKPYIRCFLPGTLS